MKDYFSLLKNKQFQKNLNKIFNYISQSTQKIKNMDALVIRYGIAFSTLIITIIYYIIKRNNKLVLSYSKNIGYIRLIKPDINKYEFLFERKPTMYTANRKMNTHFYKTMKKFYSIPNGLTNFGNNCYINVLVQVYILYNN